MDTQVADPDLARLYRETRERLVSLVSGLDDAALNAAVPACPGWSVRDVLAHLSATAADAVAGRLTGAPTEAETAAQVARFRDTEVTEIIAAWSAVAPQFERGIERRTLWPPVLDVVSHEHDVRGAIGKPGARDSAAVWHGAQLLLAGLRPPVPLRVIVADDEFRLGPDEGSELRLRTTRFEALRWRLGRRSRAQLAALDWSGDPAAVLDHLVIFSPAQRDIVE